MGTARVSSAGCQMTASQQQRQERLPCVHVLMARTWAQKQQRQGCEKKEALVLSLTPSVTQKRKAAGAPRSVNRDLVGWSRTNTSLR